ncbi:MAG: mucoidy inhibitor MuiA family protein, partial [Bacteroidota bacterium]
MQLKQIFPAILVIMSVAANAANDPKTISCDLKTVTVYRSGAEMVHNASTQLLPGNNELVIDGISNTIDINSVQINCPAAVTILSVEFANNYLVVPEVNARITSLKDSSEKLQREINKINVQLTSSTDLLDVLKANRDIKGSQAGLSVAELMKLMDYYKSKSAEIQNDISALKEKQKKFIDLASKINNQVKEEESKNTRNTGQLHLQLSVAVTGKYDFVISYITPNAFWTPTYDIRVDDIKSPLKVIYKAKVVQTTGIDWKKVKLSLSTSVPNQWGNAPVLKSWFLAYVNPVNVMERSLASNRIQSIGQSSAALNEVVIVGYANGEREMDDKSAQPLYIVNGAPMSIQEFKKLSPNVIKSKEVLKSSAATAIYGSQASGGAVI